MIPVGRAAVTGAIVGVADVAGAVMSLAKSFTTSAVRKLLTGPTKPIDSSSPSSSTGTQLFDLNSATSRLISATHSGLSQPS